MITVQSVYHFIHRNRKQQAHEQQRCDAYPHIQMQYVYDKYFCRILPKPT